MSDNPKTDEMTETTGENYVNPKSKSKSKRRQGIKLTQAERETLKPKIWSAEINGFSPTTTMKELGITEPTYYRLLNEITEKIQKTALSKERHLLSKYYARQEDIILKAISFTSQVEDPKAKAELELKRAMVLTATAQFLQSSGFTPKRTETMELSGELSIKDWLKGMISKKKEEKDG